MPLLLAAAPPVEIVPVLVAVAGLLVTTGASLTARSWYVTRHSRREWEYLDDLESDEEMDEEDEEEEGSLPLPRD
jgi:hypothetical protein